MAKRACVIACYAAEPTERRFSANLRIPLDRHRLLAGREYIREYESSHGAFRAFCSLCGSPVYARVINDPTHIRVRLGTLAKEADAKVVAHVWVRSKPDWYAICDDLSQYEAGVTDRQASRT